MRRLRLNCFVRRQRRPDRQGTSASDRHKDNDAGITAMAKKAETAKKKPAAKAAATSMPATATSPRSGALKAVR